MIGQEFPAVLGAAARGDEEAFGRLWHDLQPRLLRYFRVVSPVAAEDLASETWLGVVRGLDRFEGNEPAFRAWVFTIARHEVLDWRRRAARRPIEDLPANAPGRAGCAGRPGGRRHGGVLDPGRAGRGGRPPRRPGRGIVLRVVAGLGVDQVAAIMGKRPGTVRVLTHRGLRRLAERLGDGDRIRKVV